MLVTKDLNQAKGSITTLTQNSRTRIFLRSRREHVIMSFKNITVAGAGVLEARLPTKLHLVGLMLPFITITLIPLKSELMR